MGIKYSVVIPVYNVEAYLAKCIDSVLNQDTKSTFEVILVDDGSPDGSGLICDEYAASDSRVHVIHQVNRWISAARNRGLFVAKGEYVLYLDSDDFWEPNLLSSLDELLCQAVDIALFGYCRVSDNGTKMPCEPLMPPNGQTGIIYVNRLFEADKLHLPYPWAYAYRREFLLENKLWFKEDLRAAEDYEYNMRVLPLAKSVIGTEKLLYNYVIRGGSFTASMSKQKIMDNLNCKIAVFRQYPVSAVANDYAWFILMQEKWFDKDRAEILLLIKQNRDILSHVS